MIQRFLILNFLFSSLFVFGQDIQTDLSKFFTEEEIKDLNLLVDFVQVELCEIGKRSEFAKCLTQSIPDLVDPEQDYLQKNISWRKQKKLYRKISNSTFDKIWALGDSWFNHKPKYKFKILVFSGNTTFTSFVSSLSVSSPSIKGYADKISFTGRFGYFDYTLIEIWEHPEGTNLNDRGVQILLAIELLTANDIAQRNNRANRIEKRYWNKLQRARK